MSYETVADLIRVVHESIARPGSKITHEVEQLRGFSVPKIRHLLNNLCSFGPMNYLEIGSWSGSTFIPACYENKVNAVSIDNYSQFGPEQSEGFDAKAEFQMNCKKYFGHFQIWAQWEEDFMKVEPLLGGKPNVFMYDGPHDEESTYQGIMRFSREAGKPFILVVDDIELVGGYAWPGAQRTMNNFTIHHSRELKKADGWHEGILVMVVERI